MGRLIAGVFLLIYAAVSFFVNFGFIPPINNALGDYTWYVFNPIFAIFSQYLAPTVDWFSGILFRSLGMSLVVAVIWAILIGAIGLGLISSGGGMKVIYVETASRLRRKKRGKESASSLCISRLRFP
jgi:hypothetical protein